MSLRLPVLERAPGATEVVARAVGLEKSYRRGALSTAALRGASMEVRAGEVVFVLGPSGSGKLTLLQLLGALDTPTSGQVWLFGEEVSARDDRGRSLLRRAKLGFVFQSFHLIPALTALENVLVPRVPVGVTSEDQKRARALLEQLGLGARIGHRPDELSGGESQRVAIARALVGRPRLVLADEPTGELDTRTGAEVTAALRRAAREEGAAVVVVTHDERLVEVGDRVIRLRDGVVESDGVKELTMAEAGEYVLGTDREELDRLGLQHRCWRAQAYEHWERAGIAPGAHVLDVGCGPGFATLDLARLTGHMGRVTAVDVSRRFLEHLQRESAREGLVNVRTVEADVQALALEPASVDAAWTRWVLSFVRDPAAVVAGVARALVPGGVWALQEYIAYSSMRLGPSSKVLPRVVAAVEASWRAQGGEADIGLRLPALLEKAGFLVTESRPIARIARPGTSLWEWPTSFYESFVPKLASGGFLGQADADALLAEWRAHTEDPDAIFVCPMVVAITAVKS